MLSYLMQFCILVISFALWNCGETQVIFSTQSSESEYTRKEDASQETYVNDKYTNSSRNLSEIVKAFPTTDILLQSSHLNITVFYNEALQRLQLNITSTRNSDGAFDQINSLQFYQEEDENNGCIHEPTVDVPLSKRYVIFPENNSFNVNYNCTIDLLIISTNNTTRKTLKIPECVQEHCQCSGNSLYKPNIEKISSKKINKDTYNISWTIKHSTFDRRVDNLKNVTFFKKNYHGHIFQYEALTSVALNENQNSVVTKIKGFDKLGYHIDQTYANFENVFGCDSYLFFDIIHNISVEPFYNYYFDKVQFNVTWIWNEDEIYSDKLKLTFEALDTSSDTICSPYFQEVHVPENVTSIIFPEIVSDFEIDPNCFYNIQVLAESDNKQYFSVNNFKINEAFPTTDILLQSSHLNITVFYNEALQRLQLNITSSNSDAAFDQINSLEFYQEEDENNGCIHEPTVDVLLSKRHVIFPENNSFYLNYNCTIDLSIISTNNTTRKTLKIPECVQEHCRCSGNSLYKPNIETISSKKIDKDTYNISWTIKHSTFDRRVDTLKNVTFFKKNYHGHIIQYEALASVTLSENQNYVVTKIEGFDEFGYHINQTYANFKNVFGCDSYLFFDIIHLTPSKEPDFYQILSIVLVCSISLLTVLYLSYKGLPYIKTFCKYYEDTTSIGTARWVSIATNAEILDQVHTVDVPLYNPMEENHEFDRTKMKLIHEIGKGQFGIVFKAKLTIEKGHYEFVAVKLLKDECSDSDKEEFLREIKLFQDIGEHKHIVKMIGCATKIYPYLIVMEYLAGGSLISYLKKLRKEWDTRRNIEYAFESGSDIGSYITPDSPNTPSSFSSSIITRQKTISHSETISTYLPSEGNTPLLEDNTFVFDRPALDHKVLQNFALQIAKGMAYLETKGIIHRDLAARNILMDDNMVLKIADFGLSRSTNNEAYVMTKKECMLPIRWMAIESIMTQTFDSKSDVWSFGVVLWEMGSLGAVPYYDDFPTSEYFKPIAFLIHLQSNKRLQKPEICHSHLYKLMLECWDNDPNLRPSFAQIVKLLEDPNDSVSYVSFNTISPHYMFPPLQGMSS